MQKKALVFMAVGAVTLGSMAALAEEEGTKKCLQLNRMSSLEVVDSEHIRFEMHGGPDYMNTLPNKCPGLSKHDTIMYKSRLNQLCDLDTITVLEQIGGGFMRGPTCGLGKFVPIDEEEE